MTVVFKTLVTFQLEDESGVPHIVKQGSSLPYAETQIYQLAERKHKSYPLTMKLEAIKCAETPGMSKEATARKFGVDPKRIREWCKQKKSLENLCESGFGHRRNLMGGGRKPMFSELESWMLVWVNQLKNEGVHLTKDMIQTKAVETLESNPQFMMKWDRITFVTSGCWTEQFVARNKINL